MYSYQIYVNKSAENVWKKNIVLTPGKTLDPGHF